MYLSSSELIINPDGSIYHLHLKPGEVADTIITVGDMARVDKVAALFDQVYLERSHREFYTKTGRIGKKDLTVISSGIGTDNIDILINELDALFNVDFETRTTRENTRQLTFVRLGTSGSIRKSVPVNSLVASVYGFGMDSLGFFYEPWGEEEFAIQDDFNTYLHKVAPDLRAYVAKGDMDLANLLLPQGKKGITVSCAGFYAPQGRHLRAMPRYKDIIDHLRNYKLPGGDFEITNFEMESAGIFLLCDILGHRAVSVNAILANRETREFSSDPQLVVRQMLEKVLPSFELI
jgi:uridine phosphorylase